MAPTRVLALLIAAAAAGDALLSAQTTSSRPPWSDQLQGARSGLLGFRLDQQEPMRLPLAIPGANRRRESSQPDYIVVFRKNRGRKVAAAPSQGAPSRPWWMAPQASQGPPQRPWWMVLQTSQGAPPRPWWMEPQASQGAPQRPWWMEPQTAASRDSQQRAGQPAGDIRSRLLQLLTQEVKQLESEARRPAQETSGLARGSTRLPEQRSGDPELAAMPAVPIAFRSFINSPDIPTQCPDGTKMAHDQSCRSQWKRALS